MIFTRRLILIIVAIAVTIALSGLSSIFLWLSIMLNLALVIVFLIDWVLTPRVAQISVMRNCDEKLSLGARNMIELRLRNRSDLPISLEIKDNPPDSMEVSEEMPSVNLPANSTARVNYSLTPKLRGNYQFGDIEVRYLSRFKLFKWQSKIPQTENVKVYPNLLDLRKYDVLAKRGRFTEIGLKQSNLYGEGTEFESLREYFPDDDFRRINWKATARTGRPISEEYEVVRSQNITILLDCGRMMTATIKNMSKLDYAVNSTLMLGYISCIKGDKVGLMAFSDDIEAYIPPQGGKHQVYKLMEALYDISPKMCQPNYEKAFMLLESKLRKRSFIVVFTDLVDVEVSKALLSYLPLLRPHHLVLCITLRDSEVTRVADSIPDTVDEVYQKAVAGKLMLEQRNTLSKLQQSGVMILDATPEELSVATVNRYLELKGRNLI